MISRARCSGRGSGDGCAGLVLLRLCVILLFLKRRSGVLTIEQYTVPGFYKIARCITARMRQHPSARKVNTNATCIYFCLGETRCVFTYPATPLLQHLHLRDRLPLQRHGTRLCFALTTTTTFVPCHDARLARQRKYSGSILEDSENHIQHHAPDDWFALYRFGTCGCRCPDAERGLEWRHAIAAEQSVAPQSTTRVGVRHLPACLLCSAGLPSFLPSCATWLPFFSIKNGSWQQARCQICARPSSK